jgi:hypothetical protein
VTASLADRIYTLQERVPESAAVARRMSNERMGWRNRERRRREEQRRRLKRSREEKEEARRGRRGRELGIREDEA